MNKFIFYKIMHISSAFYTALKFENQTINRYVMTTFVSDLSEILFILYLFTEGLVKSLNIFIFHNCSFSESQESELFGMPMISIYCKNLFVDIDIRKL